VGKSRIGPCAKFGQPPTGPAERIAASTLSPEEAPFSVGSPIPSANHHYCHRHAQPCGDSMGDSMVTVWCLLAITVTRNRAQGDSSDSSDGSTWDKKPRLASRREQGSLAPAGHFLGERPGAVPLPGDPLDLRLLPLSPSPTEPVITIIPSWPCLRHAMTVMMTDERFLSLLSCRSVLGMTVMTEMTVPAGIWWVACSIHQWVTVWHSHAQQEMRWAANRTDQPGKSYNSGTPRTSQDSAFRRQGSPLENTARFI
jgi:hypothetical protein